MAQYTIEIPDDLIAEAVAAAQRANDRLPIEQRNSQAFTFDVSDVVSLVGSFLIGVIQTDAEQQAQYETAQDVAAKRQDVQTRMQAANAEALGLPVP